MSYDLYLYLCRGEVTCFDGDVDGSTDGDDDVTTGGTDDLTKDGDGKNHDDKTLSKNDMNRIVEERLARERKSSAEKHEVKYRDLESRYTTLLDNQNLSEDERGKLQENLLDVQKQLRSKEEEAKHQLQKVRDEYETQLTQVKKSGEVWERRFFDSSISRALQDAAVEHDAYNSSQVVSLLRSMTKLKPKLNEAGKETDSYEAVVDFPERDEKGSEVIMQRSPSDTVKRMKELDDFANLFKSNVVQGVGANSATGGISPGSNGQIDVRTLTPTQYAKIRKENPSLLGL